jgi:soluble lytic murein transglycosylase-like protein
MKRLATLALVLILARASPASAGAQIYEPMSESVRNRLQLAVSSTTVPVLQFDKAGDAHRWSYEMSTRLRTRMPDRKQRDEFLKLIHYYCVQHQKLDPQLILGLVQVESGFKRYAVSSAGAMGYMQVMPFWVKVIGQPRDRLFDTRTNIVYGCAILRHYLDMENGDHFRALGRYNGSLGRPEYPNAVLAHWKGRWAFDGPIR